METAQFKLISRNAANVLTLDEAKDTLRINRDDEDQDDVITACLHAAISTAEDHTERKIFDSVYDLRIVPSLMTFSLPYPNFKGVTSITAIKNDGSEEVLSESGTIKDYLTVDDYPELASLTILQFPEDTKFLIIRLTFGYATGLLPGSLLQGIKMMLSHFYDNRHAVEVGRIATQVPMGAATMFHMNRYQRF
jgi:uncharacterized phiE125 gp8 family phage protein